MLKKCTVSVGDYRAAGYGHYVFENPEQELINKIELHLKDDVIIPVNRTGEYKIPVFEGDTIDFYVQEGQPIIISGMTTEGNWLTFYANGL